MKKSIQHISIFLFAALALATISCKSSSESTNLLNGTTDSTSTMDQKEIRPAINKENLTSHYSLNYSEYNLPNRYKLFDKIHGDLNSDGVDDHVVIIKGTDKKQIVINRFGEKVDRNRRGILVYLTNKNDAILATKNLDCFSSENEDGGIYFPAQLSIIIENGRLSFHYDHGRYGFWKYTFRYHHSDFELIEYNSSENYGPIVNQETSINFLTKKKLIRKNVNLDAEENEAEIFEETWSTIKINELHKLSEIADFDELVVDR